MTDPRTVSPGGRLMQLLSARGGVAPGAPTMVLQHREALIYTLGKAAALEQLVMCQYLYAAFSMKDRDDEGLTAGPARGASGAGAASSSTSPSRRCSTWPWSRTC